MQRTVCNRQTYVTAYAIAGISGHDHILKGVGHTLEFLTWDHAAVHAGDRHYGAVAVRRLPVVSAIAAEGSTVERVRVRITDRSDFLCRIGSRLWGRLGRRLRSRRRLGAFVDKTVQAEGVESTLKGKQTGRVVSFCINKRHELRDSRAFAGSLFDWAL